MASIYGFIDHSGELRYIGKANDPAARLKSHMREMHRRSFPLYAWLRKHGEPTMIVLESHCEDWRVSEREWIAAARFAGVRLLNLAAGGDEPFCSREQRRKNARSIRHYRFTTEEARGHAIRLNERIKADPDFQKLRHMKMVIAQHAQRFGISPELWAKMAYCAVKAPHIFKRWYDRIADKYQRFTPQEFDRFERRLYEIAETRRA